MCVATLIKSFIDGEDSTPIRMEAERFVTHLRSLKYRF